MFTENKIWMAQSDKRLFLLPNMANRHGLIAGATGTGKTITMKVMAESFSDMGVPVFLADIKGDLTGMCRPGKDSADMQRRIERFGIDGFSYKAYPTRFWDIFGEVGHPVRVTVSSMGPTLLARLLGLTEIQTGVLNIVFKVADDNGLLLLDLKDLRAMLQFVGENRAEFTVEYGNVSAASIGAIQRALLAFEQEGGELFFGEPELNIMDWMHTDSEGRGYINILSSQKLIQSPTVYATFLLWMLTELFETLPEVGDLDKPKMIFFFDEAHLLFNGMPKALLQKIVRAGCQTHPLQGCRRLLHQPEPQRHSGRRAGPALQPCPACPARLHARRDEGRPRRGQSLPCQREFQDRGGPDGARRGRGAGQLP